MSRSCRMKCRSLLSVSVTAFTSLLVAGCPGQTGIGDLGVGSGGGSVVGTWNVTGELVAAPLENGTGPQAGTQVNEVWTIADTGGGTYTLTTSKGTLNGTASGNGAVFDAEVPQLDNLVLQIHIECQPGVAGLVATEEFKYVGLTYGVPNGRTQTEAWKVTGVRQ